MISLKDYQQRAVEKLLADTYELLGLSGRRQKMVLKAPTGAGKTVMMAEYLRRLVEELPQQGGVGRRSSGRSRVAFIWLAPNQLHQQSLERFRAYFAETRVLRPVQFSDVQQHLLPGDVLFLNWQSVNKETNVYVRDNEHDRTLQRYVYNTIGEGTEVLVILDEAHYYAKGKRAVDLLARLNAKLEIDVSATPHFQSENGHVIRRREVVGAEMIKRQVLLNPGLDADKQDERPLDLVLLDEALTRRQVLKDAYARLGKRINPLLLIQLPSDSAAMNPEDVRKRDEVVLWLRELYGITTQNGRLAVWLSDAKDKVNLGGIEAPDSLVDVLLFKQAIALGWDCPRSAVLLIFRELKNPDFSIQTVGRILRMPEQTHYASEPLLNEGYVYTDLSRDIIRVVEGDQDYLVLNRAVRRADYQSTFLESAYVETRLQRNRLNSRFGRCLAEAAEQKWDWNLTEADFETENRTRLAQHFVQTDVEQVRIPIPTDVVLSGEVEQVDVTHQEGFAKTYPELKAIFRAFCRANLGGYAPADSLPILESALFGLFETYLGAPYALLPGEMRTMKTVLLAQNTPRFVELIEVAMQRYADLMRQLAATKQKNVETYPWEVPAERTYNDLYVAQPAERHALEPFFEYKSASLPEQQFVRFLEENRHHLAWWYKNGESNKVHFAVPYQKADGPHTFYVDFVIRFADGTLGLFDTKTLGSDPDFVPKHNALVDYLDGLRAGGGKAIGGVLVPHSVAGHGGQDATRLWRFSQFRLSDAADHTGWESLNPAEYGAS